MCIRDRNQCRLGDTVRVEETRPISKNKHWRLLAILERKQVADVRPIDLETDVGQDITQPRVAAAEARAASTTEEPGGEEITSGDEATVQEELDDAEPELETQDQDEEA